MKWVLRRNTTLLIEIIECFSGISAPFIFAAAMQMCLEVSSVVTLFYGVIVAELP